MYTPDRSQGCRTGGSLISRWSQNRPFCCFCARKWTWLTHPRWWHTHQIFFGCLSKYSHSPKIFCGTESAGTYLYQSLEQHSERQLRGHRFSETSCVFGSQRKSAFGATRTSPRGHGWHRRHSHSPNLIRTENRIRNFPDHDLQFWNSGLDSSDRPVVLQTS